MIFLSNNVEYKIYKNNKIKLKQTKLMNKSNKLD